MSAALGRRPCAIWHDGALGDLLISLPAMALVERAFGGIDTFIARGEPGRFMAKVLGACQFLSSDSQGITTIFSGERPLPLDGVGTLVLFTRRPGGELASRLAGLFGRVLHVIDTAPHERVSGVGRSLYEQEFSRAKALFGGNGGLTDYIPICRRDRHGDYWALHPGSGGIEKCWPITHFRALTRAIRGLFPHLGVRIILGPVEEERPEEVLPLLEEEGVRGMVRAPLEEVFRTLSRSLFYVGNDSGISHLAAAAGTTCFIIFGPTDPATWAPPFPWVHVIGTKTPGPVQAVKEEDVVSKILKTIST